MTKNMLFLGAGASVQFDMPTTADFKTDLQKNKPGNTFFNPFLDSQRLQDIEHVLQTVKELRED